MVLERERIFDLFREAIGHAHREIEKFTASNIPIVEEKVDSSLVTACDKHVDTILTRLFNGNGFRVVSEEGPEACEIVRGGTYVTIDPIDGTGLYLRHVNEARWHNSPLAHKVGNLGRQFDYALLLGLVESSKPRFGATYNYITGETILLDSSGADHMVRESEVPIAGKGAKNAQYLESRTNDLINNTIRKDRTVCVIREADPYGLRALFAQINGHNSATAIHRAQKSGLWDILPAAVAAQYTGARVLDDDGLPMRYDEYCLVPGRGITLLFGKKFFWVENALKKVRPEES